LKIIQYFLFILGINESPKRHPISGLDEVSLIRFLWGILVSLDLQERPTVSPEQRQIWNPLLIGRVVLQDNTSWKHSLEVLDEIGLVITLELRSSHNTSFFLGDLT
jgi:hypothetical protein